MAKRKSGKRADSKAAAQRHEIFARALVEGKTQSDAYRLAFPKSAAWKAATVHKRACELAKNRKVMGRVEALKQRAVERHAVTLDNTMRYLWDLIHLDAGKLVDEGGAPLPISQLPPDIRKLIAPKGHELAVGKGQAVELLRRFFNFWKGHEGGTFGMPYVAGGGESEPPRSGAGVTFVDARSINFHDVPPERAARIYRDIMDGKR